MRGPTGEQVVGDEIVEGVGAHQGHDLRVLVGEDLEDPEEVHVGVNVDPLDGRELPGRANDRLEISSRATELHQTLRHAFGRRDQIVELTLNVSEWRARECAASALTGHAPAPPPRWPPPVATPRSPRPAAGCRRRARSTSRPRRTAAPPRDRAPTPRRRPGGRACRAGASPRPGVPPGEFASRDPPERRPGTAPPRTRGCGRSRRCCSRRAAARSRPVAPPRSGTPTRTASNARTPGSWTRSRSGSAGAAAPGPSERAGPHARAPPR